MIAIRLVIVAMKPPTLVSQARAGVALPWLLDQLESRLTVRACKKQLLPKIRNEALLHQALTAPSCILEADYERLETLGDSVIKVCVCVCE